MSESTLLSRSTGLSEQFFRSDRELTSLRFARFEGAAQAAGANWLRQLDYPEDAIATYLAQSKEKPLAVFINNIVGHEDRVFKQSRKFASIIDSLIVELTRIYESGTFASYKQAVLRWIRRRPRAWALAGVIGTPSTLRAIESSRGWNQMFHALKPLCGMLHLGLLANLDIDCARSLCGSELKPISMFEVLKPRRGLKADGSSARPLKHRGRRPGVIRPTRLLMEMTFALIEWAREGQWAKVPPAPKSLAQAFDLSEPTLKKLFSGRQSLDDRRWSQMLVAIAGSIEARDQLPSELLVLLLGCLEWEHVLNEEQKQQNSDKQSSTILDAVRPHYMAWWSLLLKDQRASRSPKGEQHWPDWLTAAQ